jgi:hypothetical protein
MDDYAEFESEFTGIVPSEVNGILKCAVIRHKISNELHNLTQEQLEATFAFVRSFNIERRIEDLRKR